METRTRTLPPGDILFPKTRIRIGTESATPMDTGSLLIMGVERTIDPRTAAAATSEGSRKAVVAGRVSTR